ncbi:hypothetical protein B5F37_03000 [Drancourtella sp. An210]|uniref:PH domain-containing protein n=1 Tax=Sellimonas sp. TaxID=2021466 RepID=UPI000B3A84AD|nr:hypothetical protein B5F37_03000 [Drancourtella sp. An210]
MDQIRIVQLIYLGIYLLLCATFYWTYIQEARTRFGHPFMVRITAVMAKEESVQEILGQYKKRIRLFFFVCVFLGAIIFFLPPQWGFVWMILSGFVQIMLPSRIERTSRKRLMLLKQEKQWFIRTESRHKIDLKLDRKRSNQSMPSSWWFLIPIVIQCIAFVYCLVQGEGGKTFAAVCVLGLLIIAAGIGFIRWLPNKTYCEESTVNQRLNGKKKAAASRAWLWICSGDAVWNLGIAGFLYSERLQCLFLAGAALIVSVTAAILALTEYGREKQYELASEVVYEYDEETYWDVGWFGLRYSNPYDPQVFKENNSGGLNLTVNQAARKGKWMTAGIILFCAGIALFVVWQFAYPKYLDEKGLLADLVIEDGVIRVTGPLYNAKIPKEQVVEAELTDDLGEGIRTNGSSTASYGKGKFRYDKYGNVRVYLAWKHRPYLVLKTETDIYIVNDDDPAQTIRIYEEIKGGNGS